MQKRKKSRKGRKKKSSTLILTGTPGTGKSTAAKKLHDKHGFAVFGVNDFVEKGDALEDVSVKIKNAIKGKGGAVIEGHFSHLLGMKGLCIVLRTHPRELERRLKKKKYSEKKIRENLEAEALDVCLIESVQRYKAVYEIDTTHLSPEETAAKIIEITGGKEKKFRAGSIDWSEEFFA